MSSGRIFIVVPKAADANVPTVKRLIRAKRESQVGAHLLADWSIEVATVEDVIAATKEGVEVEEVEEAGDA